MWKNILLKTTLLLTLLTGFTACQDDDVIDETKLEAGPVSISVPQNPWHIPSRADFYMFLVESQGYAWTASTESDWLTLDTTQGLHGSTYLRFSVEENTDPFARVAVITVADSQNPDEFRLQVRIRQSGYNDEDNATLTGDMLKKHRMGYGYDVMKDYASDESFSDLPILDYEQVVKLEEEKNMLIISEDRRHYQEIETFSGNTLTELASELTNNMTSGGTFLGCGKVTTSSTSVFRSKTIEQSCGYIRLKQITSSRTIDLGALAAEATSDDSPLYSKEFREAIRNMKSVGDASNIINTFGTHIVSSADLGGSISLEVLISREQSVEEEHSVKTVTKKVFGKKTSQSSSTYDKYVEQNGLDYQASIDCTGGTVATQNAIKAYIDRKEQVPSSAIINWQNSFQDDPAETQDYNVGMVGCQLAPIYTLINDPTKRAWMEEAFEKYTNTQVTKYEDTPAHVAVWEAMIDFWDKGNKRVLLGKTKGNASVLLAKEYVPSIRTDKTVIVAYPVLNNKAFFYGGVFVGDKEHVPGYVRWLGNNPIYEPFEDEKFQNYEGNELFHPDEGTLLELYIYNGGIHAIKPEDYNYNEYTALSELTEYHPGAYIEHMPFVKVGPYLWAEKGNVLDKYFPPKSMIDFVPGTDTRYRFCFIDNNMYTFSLPTVKELESLMQITTTYNPDILFNLNSEYYNEIGAMWAKGYIYAVIGPEFYQFSGDKTAFVFATDNDNKICIGRLSPSKKLNTFTTTEYFRFLHMNVMRPDGDSYIQLVEVLSNIPTD